MPVNSSFYMHNYIMLDGLDYYIDPWCFVWKLKIQNMRSL